MSQDPLLQNCENEPIHEIGAIQNHGFILAIKVESVQCLNVVSISENLTQAQWMKETNPELILDHNIR